MDKELLEILVCPKTKMKLIPAPQKVLEKINQSIAAGTCKDMSGESIRDTIEEGLLQPEAKIFYMIHEGIPVLIYDNAISAEKL